MRITEGGTTEGADNRGRILTDRRGTEIEAERHCIRTGKPKGYSYVQDVAPRAHNRERGNRHIYMYRSAQRSVGPATNNAQRQFAQQSFLSSRDFIQRSVGPVTNAPRQFAQSESSLQQRFHTAGFCHPDVLGQGPPHVLVQRVTEVRRYNRHRRSNRRSNRYRRCGPKGGGRT